MTLGLTSLVPSFLYKPKMSRHSDRDPANPQGNSPLFNLIPAEVRNQIFDLVLTAYDDKAHPYPQNAYYYRPNFRYAHRIDTALLRTCRRAYIETHDLPGRLNSRVEWHNPSRGPPVWTAEQGSPHSATSVHLFMQQVCLQSWDQRAYRLTQEFDHLRELKITIRHSDWWYWEAGHALGLDPTSSGSHGTGQPADVNAPLIPNGAWGRSFYYFEGLERFVLELETRAGKKSELDAIVTKGKEWRFELGDGNSLVLDPAKTKRKGWIGSLMLGAAQTKRTGWLGLPFCTWFLTQSVKQVTRANPIFSAAGRQFRVDPAAAKRELMADGVEFRVEDGEPEFEGSSDECLVYYVVTLTYCKERRQDSERDGRRKAYHESKDAYARLFERESA